MTDLARSPVHAAMQARITAEILAFGRSISMFSTLLFFAAIAGVVLLPRGAGFLLGASAVPAAVQGYFALRVRLDAGIFRFWADHWRSGADPEVDMAAFDDVIGVPRQGRPLASRSAGARRLLIWQAGLVLIQSVLLGAGLYQALSA